MDSFWKFNFKMNSKFGVKHQQLPRIVCTSYQTVWHTIQHVPSQNYHFRKSERRTKQKTQKNNCKFTPKSNLTQTRNYSVFRGNCNFQLNHMEATNQVKSPNKKPENRTYGARFPMHGQCCSMSGWLFGGWLLNNYTHNTFTFFFTLRLHLHHWFTDSKRHNVGELWGLPLRRHLLRYRTHGPESSLWIVYGLQKKQGFSHATTPMLHTASHPAVLYRHFASPHYYGNTHPQRPSLRYCYRQIAIVNVIAVVIFPVIWKKNRHGMSRKQWTQSIETGYGKKLPRPRDNINEQAMWVQCNCCSTTKLNSIWACEFPIVGLYMKRLHQVARCI